MVDFEWYRSFVAVYTVGTVTGAAAARQLTQPAVSQHLAALEAAVGGKLFTRTPRRMIPTDRGAALYTRVVPAVEALERAVRPPPTALPMVRLGAPREYFGAVMVDSLDAGLRWTVLFGTARQLLEALTRGELDLVVATERLILRGIEFRRLVDEEFVLVGAAALEPPEGEPEALTRWLLEQRWLAYGPDLPIIRRFWRQSLAQRPSIQPALVLPDLTLLVRAVAVGLGISVLPRYLCAAALADGTIRELWRPAMPVTNEIWLAWRAADRAQPALIAARDVLERAS